MLVYELLLFMSHSGVSIMNQESIVPEVIDVAPQGTISVTYPSGKEVKFGNELTPTEVKDEPTVSWEANSDEYYLLIMTDHDTPEEVREVKHWLVGNIKGSDLSTGEVFAEYLGSGPPKGTGLHKYIFLVYKQPQKIDFHEPPRVAHNSRANRLKFSVRNFAKEYNLGDPVAGNYYKAQWDEYVDERNKHMC
ncbi:protein D3-like [Coccinella septempunctata]|uniref:protein D3-like n=1 Tax=Coccinella septempunctata TaxID=41139 RepID=UPI001D079B50|nr:protein D3-like [Coccinella septempunctata]